MNLWLSHTIILGAGFLTLFGLGELFYHKFGVNGELTRKLSHVGTGILILLFPSFIGNILGVGLLCLSFLVLLLLSIKFNFLKSINEVDRKTYGSILYPVIVFGCYLIAHYKSNGILFYLPLLVMAICDPIAAIVGKKLSFKPFEIFGQVKSLGGSIAFLISSIILCYLLNQILQVELTWANIIALGVCGAIAEAVSTKGWDNLTIPITLLILLLWM